MNKYIYLLMIYLKTLKVMFNLKIFGSAYMFNFKGLKYYIFKCYKHGSVINYVSGWNNDVKCPICQREIIKTKELI